MRLFGGWTGRRESYAIEQGSSHVLFFRHILKAQDIWDDIVVEYPTDILALKLLTGYGLFYGPKERIRDSVARVLPLWKKEIPLYG